MTTMIAIRPYESSDAPYVSAMNRAWLEEYALLEPADEPFLADPGRDIIEAGGAIFVAADEQGVVGSVAMLPTAPDTLELLKLAVAPRAQGHGVGRRLVETGLDFARARGAARVTLVSNTRLAAAVRIYERIGFQHRPLPHDLPYETADVYMELTLSPAL